MALMDESVWRGKIFSGGWVGGDLGTGLDASVIKPTTGLRRPAPNSAGPLIWRRRSRIPAG
jgi:hypothetical protein